MSFSKILKQSLHKLNCCDDSKWDEEINATKIKEKILPVFPNYFLITSDITLASSLAASTLELAWGLHQYENFVLNNQTNL